MYPLADIKENVFEQIYNENVSKIYLFIYKMCGDSDLAEELTQETFLRSFAAFPSYRGESKVYTWLAAIAKNTYFTYLKKNKLYMDAIPLEEAVVHFFSNENNLQDGDFLKEDIYNAMRELVYELPDKYKETVLLRIYAEMSFKEVAETMGISENSAKVLYFRAKNKLKERLKDEFEL